MKTLIIKDLAVSKALRGDELAAVRGGSNFVTVYGPAQSAQNGGGFSLGSPVFQVAPQNVSATETNVQIANVLNSMGTLVGQAKWM